MILTGTKTAANIINHIMITLYKQTGTKGLYYKEMWYEDSEKVLIEHFGKVGYVGTVTKTNMAKEEVDIHLQHFSNVCVKEGYATLPDNQLYVIVVQFLLKSKDGNKRDKWLKDKVSEYLKEHLGWRGIGVVESFGIDNDKLNIYCIVVDEERAVSAIKSCLKTYRLDLTHAIIAARNWDDEGFRVKYSHKPINDFSVI